MTLSARTRKLSIIVGSAVAAVLLAIVAAPYLLNVEAYKPAMSEAVKSATGRELVIDGRMQLSMFPTPHIAARNVRFANAVGAKGAQMVDVKWVTVTPSWSALLGGRVEIGVLTLVQPTIVLETDAEGRPNWEFQPDAGARQSPGEASSGFNLTSGKLAIEDGTLNYTDPKSGTSIVARKIEALAAVGSLAGPFEFSGTAVVNDLPLKLDAKVSAPTARGHDVSFALKVDIGTLDFIGSMSEIGPQASIFGHLSLATASVSDFTAKLVRASGQPAPSLHPAIAGKFTFDGGIEVTPSRVAIVDFRMGFGGEQASGSLALSEKPKLALEGKLSLPKLDADKWRAALARSDGLIPDATKARIAAASTLSPFPSDMDVTLALDIAEVTLEKGTLRDVALAVSIQKGIISLSRLAANLPGDLALSADSTSGQVSLRGSKFRETLVWLGMDASDVPAGRLGRLELNGKFATTAGKLQVTNATFDLDDQHGTGSATLTLGPPTAIALQAEMANLNLDLYLPPPSKDFLFANLSPPATMGLPPIQPPPDLAALPITIKAKVAKLVYRKETFAGLDSDVTLQGTAVKLTDLKVANALGGRIALRGTVSDLATVPKYDLTVDVSAPDADRVMGFVGLPVLRNGAIGAASFKGGVAGTGRTAVLRNVNAAFLGATVQATGTLSFEGRGHFDFSSFAIKSADISRLVGAASGKTTSGLGAVVASGKLSGSMERAVFNGEADIHGVRMNGTVDATLGARPQIVADLKVPGTLDLDKWLGVSTEPAAASGVAGSPAAPIAVTKGGAVTAEPINTSALNGFDAKLTLRTSAMMIASLRVNYADVDATLRNGTLTVSRLTGQFYGGGVDASGTVKTGGNGLAVDFKGNVIGIYLGEMLRGTTGRNSFGSSNLTLTLDGKINATNMQLSGAGRTPEEIRNGLKGAATLGGYLYPAVDQSSRSSALFLGGIGSLFSDDLKAAVLVLQRFVNRQNPIQGQVTLANGAITTNNQQISGDRASARITTNTNVATAMTQTTIAFDTGGNGSSGLVTTVTGPLSAPNIDTSRRAASGN